MTSVSHNPLVDMNIDWTEEMVADLRKYESEVKSVLPVCPFSNATTVAVSKMFVTCL